MIKIHERLWVGDDEGYLKLFGSATGLQGWTIVHAARDPWHRKFVGYTGKGAPKDSPEYLYAQRGNELALNLFDTPDVNFVSPQLMRAAVNFIKTTLKLNFDTNVLVHCNQGLSRGPTIGMLCIADVLGPDYDAARKTFEEVYSLYKPMKGLEDFARLHWSEYYENVF